jgi:hypothetical protein
MAEPNQTREGYLVLADITGYTKFLTGSELEHAQGIISELMSLIVASLAPPLRFVKSEGDAIFCCAESSLLADGERLLELVEVCYLQFSNRVGDMARATTCRCTACAAIGTLDLKFIAHFGTFAPQRVAGQEDVAGADVILAHRLLKNSITQQTGCCAYAFFTDPCLANLPTSLPVRRHSETYESLGETAGGVYDLKPVLEGQRQAPRRYIGPDEADIEFTSRRQVAPAVLWQYYIEPEKRLQWHIDAVAEPNEPNEQGRLGVGAASHCDHGSGVAFHRYVDWRPFSYFTTELTFSKSSFLFRPCLEMTEFVPEANGWTTTHYRLRLVDRGWLSRLKLRLFAPFFRRLFAQAMERLRTLLENQYPDAQGAGGN